MVYFPVRYDSRVVIYERKMFIRLATELTWTQVDAIVAFFCFDGVPNFEQNLSTSFSQVAETVNFVTWSTFVEGGKEPYRPTW